MSIRVYNSSNTSWIPAKDMWVYDGSNWRRHTSMKIGDSGAWVEVLAAERTNISNTYVSSSYGSTTIGWSSNVASGISATELITENGTKINVTSITAYSGMAGAPPYVPAIPPNITFACSGVGSAAHIGDTLDVRNTSNNYGYTLNFANSSASYNANTGVTSYVFYGSPAGLNPIYTNIFASGPYSNGNVSTAVRATVEWNISAQSISGTSVYSPPGGTENDPEILFGYSAFSGVATVSISHNSSVPWYYIKTGSALATASSANGASATSITFNLPVGPYPSVRTAEYNVNSGGSYWTVYLEAENT